MFYRIPNPKHVGASDTIFPSSTLGRINRSIPFFLALILICGTGLAYSLLAPHASRCYRQIIEAAKGLVTCAVGNGVVGYSVNSEVLLTSQGVSGRVWMQRYDDGKREILNGAEELAERVERSAKSAEEGECGDEKVETYVDKVEKSNDNRETTTVEDNEDMRPGRQNGQSQKEEEEEEEEVVVELNTQKPKDDEDGAAELSVSAITVHFTDSTIAVLRFEEPALINCKDTEAIPASATHGKGGTLTPPDYPMLSGFSSKAAASTLPQCVPKALPVDFLFEDLLQNVVYAL